MSLPVSPLPSSAPDPGLWFVDMVLSKDGTWSCRFANRFFNCQDCFLGHYGGLCPGTGKPTRHFQQFLDAWGVILHHRAYSADYLVEFNAFHKEDGVEGYKEEEDYVCVARISANWDAVPFHTPDEVECEEYNRDVSRPRGVLTERDAITCDMFQSVSFHDGFESSFDLQ
jgi:hypothetical protein